MFREILIASAGLLLLGACQQPQQSQPVSAPPARNYTVLFNTGSAALSPEAQTTLSQAANAYKALGARSVAVTGHTDTVGSAGYNLQLSQQRAAAVSDWLQRGGVPGGAIAALGYGEQNLPVPTAQNVAERRNRSVDIVLSDKTAQMLMSDTQYCKALSTTYRRYRPGNIDEVSAEAMSKCETADAASAVPVLERSLRDMRVPLPSRTVPS
jgi:hypothetical protein